MEVCERRVVSREKRIFSILFAILFYNQLKLLFRVKNIL